MIGAEPAALPRDGLAGRLAAIALEGLIAGTVMGVGIGAQALIVAALVLGATIASLAPEPVEGWRPRARMAWPIASAVALAVVLHRLNGGRDVLASLVQAGGATLLLWHRSGAYAAGRVGRSGARRLAMLALVGLAVRGILDGSPAVAARAVLPLALALGLLALSVDRSGEGGPAARGGRARGVVFGLIAIILAVGLVGGEAIAPGAGQALRDLLAQLLRALVWLFTPLLWLLSQIIGLFARLMAGIFRRPEVAAALAELAEQLGKLGVGQTENTAESLREGPLWLRRTLHGLALAAFTVLVALGLAHVRRRRASRGGATPGLAITSEASLGRLGADLRAWLAGRRPGGDAGPGGGVARRRYRELLSALAKAGLERPAPQTPLAFLPRAQAALPSASDALAELTDLYHRERYSPALPSSVDEARAEAAWGAIRGALEGGTTLVE